MMPLRPVVPLTPEHDRSSFDSGVESMDRYLRTQALQDVRRRVAAVFVATRAESPRVLGYYTLSSLSIALGELPVAISKRLPRYPEVPTTLMGRLAVHRSCRGTGMRLGEHLLMDALVRSLNVSQQVASHAVVVDVLETQPDPLGFYLRYGFQPLPESPRRLFLPLDTVRRLVECAE